MTSFRDQTTLIPLPFHGRVQQIRSVLKKKACLCMRVDASFRFRISGIQPICFAAVDNFGIASTQHCLAVAIGGSNTNLNTPSLVQGTASPVGTVMKTQSRFSIQSMCCDGD